MQNIIVDTNILVAALSSPSGGSREVIRRVLTGRAAPMLSIALFSEYEDVLGRPQILQMIPLSSSEIADLFDAFLSTSKLVETYFNWRPNLRDEGDNHVMELAVAAGDATIVTHNLRDFAGGQLRFPHIRAMTPAQWLSIGD
jgi:uncharacterized protein